MSLWWNMAPTKSRKCTQEVLWLIWGRDIGSRSRPIGRRDKVLFRDRPPPAYFSSLPPPPIFFCDPPAAIFFSKQPPFTFPFVRCLLYQSFMGTMRYFQAWKRCPCKEALHLWGYPGVQKQYRATEIILVIKVCYVLYSQPLTHGPVGYWLRGPEGY